MFDFAWSEMAVLGVIALVVIGPKDLPKALKTAGFMVRRARMMAREFQNSVDDMIREAELDEIRKTAQQAAAMKEDLIGQIDPTADLHSAAQPPAAPLPTPTPGPAAAEPTIVPDLAAHHAAETQLAEAAAPAHPETSPRIPPAP